MKKRLCVLSMSAALVISAAACGASGNAPSSRSLEAAPSSSQAAEPASEEAKTRDEGVDTKCEVKYTAYSGKHADMFLKAGDKIAVISPSALPGREQTDTVIKGLKDWGYEPVEGKHVCENPRTLEAVLEDLTWSLEDPEIKAVFCVRGGYASTEVADKLAIDLVKKSNKLIIGYSDISVYHSAWSAAGVPSIHACMSGTFGDFPKECFEAEEKILKGELPTYTCENKAGREGNAKGVLIGGNLSTFTGVIGAAYDCTKSGQPYILFLEDIGEDVQHIHRYLTVLKHTGILDNAAGIVFGEWTEVPLDMDDYDGSSRGGEFKSVEDMIMRQIVSDLKVPVAFGFPAGHGDTNYPLLMGAPAELKVEQDKYTLACGV